jgi:outer membrane protein
MKGMQGSIRLFALILVCAIGPAHVGAQQLTRVAVVDMARVLASLPRDPVALRDFDQKKAEVQAEIDRMSDLIRAAQARKAEADRMGNTSASTLAEAEILSRTNELREYVRQKQPYLEDLVRRIPASPVYVQQISRQIQSVAEADGYSLVLQARGADSSSGSLVWYSPAIDITDMVLKSLSGKSQ